MEAAKIICSAFLFTFLFVVFMDIILGQPQAASAIFGPGESETQEFGPDLPAAHCRELPALLGFALTGRCAYTGFLSWEEWLVALCVV